MMVATPASDILAELQALLAKMTPQQKADLRKACKKSVKTSTEQDEPKPPPSYMITYSFKCNLCETPQELEFKTNTPSPESLDRIQVYWCNSCETSLTYMDVGVLIEKLLTAQKKLYPKRVRRD